MLLASHMIYIIESYEFLSSIGVFLSIYNVLYSKEILRMCLSQLPLRNSKKKLLEKNYQLSFKGNNFQNLFIRYPISSSVCFAW